MTQWRHGCRAMRRSVCNAGVSNAGRSFAFRYQGNGATLSQYIDTTRNFERQLIALQLCRWHFLNNETLQQTFRPVLSKLSKRRQIYVLYAHFYSARNCIASAVLATAIPSARLSVTRRYCVKTTARSTMQFSPLDSKMCLVLYKPKKYSPGTTPSPWNLGSKWPTPSLMHRVVTHFAL